MKRVFYLAAMLATGILISACDWTFQIYQPTGPSVFIVNQNTDKMEVGPEAQEQVVYIASDMVWYAALQDGSWCTLLDQDLFNEFTSSLRFKVQANSSMESRTDSLIVVSGNETRKIAIIQSGMGALLGTDEIVLYSTLPVQYKLNSVGSWTAEKDGSWFSVSPDRNSTGGLITFTANGENIDTQDRVGSVTFKLNGLDLTVPVKQKISETIFVGSKTLALESTGGDFTILTLTNVEYRVSSDVDWIHPLGTRALLSFEEPFSADANNSAEERVGHITFTYEDLTETVTVTQAGKDVFLDITTPGFYGVNGTDYVYRKGLCQTGRLTSGSKRSFRLIIPSEVCVVELSGLPLTLTTGQDLQLRVLVHKGGQTIYSQPVSVKVMAENEKLIWLKSSASTYFILKKQ